LGGPIGGTKCGKIVKRGVKTSKRGSKKPETGWKTEGVKKKISVGKRRGYQGGDGRGKGRVPDRKPSTDLEETVNNPNVIVQKKLRYRAVEDKAPNKRSRRRLLGNTSTRRANRKL